MTKTQTTRRPAQHPDVPQPWKCQCGHVPHSVLGCQATNPAGDQGRCWCLADWRLRYGIAA